MLCQPNQKGIIFHRTGYSGFMANLRHWMRPCASCLSSGSSKSTPFTSGFGSIFLTSWKRSFLKTLLLAARRHSLGEFGIAILSLETVFPDFPSCVWCRETWQSRRSLQPHRRPRWAQCSHPLRPASMTAFKAGPAQRTGFPLPVSKPIPLTVWPVSGQTRPRELAPAVG